MEPAAQVCLQPPGKGLGSLGSCRIASYGGRRAGPHPLKKEPSGSDPLRSRNTHDEAQPRCSRCACRPASLRGDGPGSRAAETTLLSGKSSLCLLLFTVAGRLGFCICLCTPSRWSWGAGGGPGRRSSRFSSSTRFPGKETGSPPNPSRPRRNHGCGWVESGSSLSCPCWAYFLH